MKQLPILKQIGNIFAGDEKTRLKSTIGNIIGTTLCFVLFVIGLLLADVKIGGLGFDVSNNIFSLIVGIVVAGTSGIYLLFMIICNFTLLVFAIVGTCKKIKESKISLILESIFLAILIIAIVLLLINIK